MLRLFSVHLIEMASRKNMRSRRNKNSRRNRNRSRKQRGGLVLTPGAFNAPTILLPGGVGALVQGAQFAQQHIGQHGGAAPLGVETQLPSGMADAAMQGKLLGALNEIKGMSDMAGGRRRRRRTSRKSGKKASRKGSARKTSKKSRKSRKGSRKSRKGSARKTSRRQRGGQAPVSASYMTGVEAKGTHPQYNDFASL